MKFGEGMKFADDLLTLSEINFMSLTIKLRRTFLLPALVLFCIDESPPTDLYRSRKMAPWMATVSHSRMFRWLQVNETFSPSAREASNRHSSTAFWPTITSTLEPSDC